MSSGKAAVALVLLNYNGCDLLKKYLPSCREAVRRSRHACRLVVLDNCSQDGSEELVRREFPDALFWKAPQNRVLCSYNDLAREVPEDILIFLNNDILVEPDFIDPLVEPILKNADVFFVTPRCLSLTDRTYESGRTKAGVRFGLFGASALYKGHEAHVDQPGLTFQGGFGAFDRKKFLELDGYDELYFPGRLEDADICFRAFKKGWRCLYEPKSVVYHEGGVSFKKSFGEKHTLVINWKNTFLFMWKNLDDTTNFVFVPFWLPLRMMYSLLKGRTEMPAGFFKALPHFKAARLRRRAAYPTREARRAVTDRFIFDHSTDLLA